MSKSWVHHCDKQIEMAVETHRLEPPVGSCTCRKYVSLKEATNSVAIGEASWVVTKRTLVTIDICSMCGGDPEVKNCSNCRGTGLEEINGVIEHYGTDIVLVSRPMLNEKDRKSKIIRLKNNTPRKHPAIQTPRTPTIEAAHIVAAYGDGLVVDKTFADEQDAVKYHIRVHDFLVKRVWLTQDKLAKVARDRIEEYGILIQFARLLQGKDNNLTIVPEPEDNREKGEGPNEDYGWGAMRTCAFEDAQVFEEVMVKDKPSLDGQRNFEQSQARQARLAEIMRANDSR